VVELAITNQFKEQQETQVEDWLSGLTYYIDLGTSTQAESVSDTDLIQPGEITRKAAQTETLDRTTNRLTTEFWFASTDANDLLTTANTGSETYDTDTNLGSTNWLSQSFQVPVDTNITQVRMYSKFDSGSPAPDINIEIRPDTGGGVPSGNIITNGSTSIADFYETSYDWKSGVFGNPPALTANTTYHFVVHASGADSGSVYMWGADASSPTYGSGNKISSTDGGSNWTPDTNTDFVFKVYGNKINENGVFDSLTSGSLFIRNKHTAITKDSDTEILITYNLDYSININE